MCDRRRWCRACSRPPRPTRRSRRRARLASAAGRRGHPDRPRRRWSSRARPGRTSARALNRAAQGGRRATGWSRWPTSRGRSSRQVERSLPGVARRQGAARDGLHPRRRRRGARPGGARRAGRRRRRHRARASPRGCRCTARTAQVGGWTLDLMRRRQDGSFRAGHRVPDRLVVPVLQGPRGAQFVSLSGAPLARAATTRTATARRLDDSSWTAGRAARARLRLPLAARVQGQVPAALDPMYLASPRRGGPARAIGIGITRAYLPTRRVRDLVALVRS